MLLLLGIWHLLVTRYVKSKRPERVGLVVETRYCDGGAENTLFRLGMVADEDSMRRPESNPLSQTQLCLESSTHYVWRLRCTYIRTSASPVLVQAVRRVISRGRMTADYGMRCVGPWIRRQPRSLARTSNDVTPTRIGRHPLTARATARNMGCAGHLAHSLARRQGQKRSTEMGHVPGLDGGIEASIKVAWVLHVRGSLSTDRSRFPPLHQPHRSLSAR